MQRSRQGQSFPKSKRLDAHIGKSMRKTPGPAAYAFNLNSTKRTCTPKTMGIRYNGGSQVVSGIGFMGKPNRPGDNTPGPGAYSFDSRYTNNRTHRVPLQKRFGKRPGVDPEITPGPAMHVQPFSFGQVGSGGLLSSSMNSPSVSLKSHGKVYIAANPSPCEYSPYESDCLGTHSRAGQKSVFMSRKPVKQYIGPGPGHYNPEEAQTVRKSATMKFRRPVARISVQCGGGWLGRQQVPDPNTPGPQSYATQESNLSKNFPVPPSLFGSTGPRGSTVAAT